MGNRWIQPLWQHCLSFYLPSYCFEFMPFHCKWNILLRTHQIKALSLSLVSHRQWSAVSGSSANTSHRYFNDILQVKVVVWTCHKQDVWTQPEVFIHGVGRGQRLTTRSEDGDPGGDGSLRTWPRGQWEDWFTCICSCRAAAQGAERCVCATRGGGYGCSVPRWVAAGGSAQMKSGQSFHRRPEETRERERERWAGRLVYTEKDADLLWGLRDLSLWSTQKNENSIQCYELCEFKW